MLFRPSQKLATSAFIWLLLENSKTKEFVTTNLAGGSASPHVNVQSLKNMEVISPPFYLQQQLSRIVSRFNDARKKIIESERQAEHRSKRCCTGRSRGIFKIARQSFAKR
jgi:hypothetical protein